MSDTANRPVDGRYFATASWLTFPVGIVVCTEEGSRRVFASALEWPGWCRSGRSEAEALDNLAAYASRYAPVAERAGIRFSAKPSGGFQIVERLAGNVTTDFGAPAIPARYDREPLGAKGAARLAVLVAGCWQVFDEVVAGAPAELRKGPRGGGRDRDKIVQHVAEAEIAYARKLGIRGHDLAPVREALVSVLGSSRHELPTETAWPRRYAARRIAWHVLDHAWEIEDKS